MLCPIVDIGLKVPLRRHVVGALLRRLVISLQQEIPHLLQIHLVESIVYAICIHTPVKIVRVGPGVTWIVPSEIWIIPSKVGIVVDIYPVIAIRLIIRPQSRTGIPPVPIVYVGITVVVDIRVDPPERRRDREDSRRARILTWPSCAESEVLILDVILIPRGIY